MSPGGCSGLPVPPPASSVPDLQQIVCHALAVLDAPIGIEIVIGFPQFTQLVVHRQELKPVVLADSLT